MRLISFAFEDLESGWTLEEMRFGEFNLLLGISGVGKSRILRSLRHVRDLGLPFGAMPELRRCKWTLEFEPGARAPGVCVWSGEVGSLPATSDGADGAAQHLGIIRESVVLGGVELIRRDDDGLKWRGNPTVGLRPTRSALALIDDGEAPHIAASLGMLYFLDATDDLRVPHVLSDIDKEIFGGRRLMNPLDTAQIKYVSTLSNVEEGLSKDILSDFINIFAFVKNVGVMGKRDNEGRLIALFSLKDVDSKKLLEQDAIASGMLRTLIYLVHLHTAPEGFVFIVDDFENSMGINCLEPMLKIFEARSKRTQIVLTSHHPFVINDVPESAWRIVQRRGSKVRVRDASAFPGLMSSSKQSPFTRLISSTAYDEGIMPAEEAAQEGAS